MAPLTYQDWKQQAHTIADMAAFRQLRYAFAGDGVPLDVPSVRATANLFSVLRANAIVGRTFTRKKASPVRPRRASQPRVLGTPFRRIAQDVIGQTIQLDALPYTVVGVMAADFDFPPSGDIDVWTPLSFDPADGHGRSRKARSLNVVGRLADDTTPEQAQQEMGLVARRLASTYADSNTGWSARVVAAQEQLVTTVRPALLLISSAVGFLLLIVCANVANLILARLSSRRTEIAVRAALGAGRMQIVRQVMAESFVLSAIGGTLGLFVAWAGVRFVHALPEGSLPRMQQVQLDGGVLLFALLSSIFVALVFGLVPALQVSRAALRDTTNAFSGTTVRSHSRCSARSSSWKWRWR